MAVSYTLELPETLNQDLSNIARKLKISEGQVLQRAITLLRLATEADQVDLVKDGQHKTIEVD